MTINRRKFVRTGVVATALAAVPLSLVKAAASPKGNPQPLIAGSGNGAESHVGSLDPYSKTRFTPHVNSQFNVRSSHLESTKVTLVEVADYCEQGKSDECFSLRFTGSASKAFKQNTYEVEHTALGKLSLFLVPVGMRSGGTVHYEAIINRRFR